MKMLLHVCCGPCAIFPLETLREEGHEVMGFFSGRNIHPYSEYLRREQALRQYAETAGFRVVYAKEYDMEGFLRQTAFREANRCRFCYHDRLIAAAHVARRGRFDAFTTTLLYSTLQKHGLIAEIGESIGKSVGVPFAYRDFRPGWKAGIEKSKELGLYRQQYCGCIYSEKERFFHPADQAGPSA